MDYFVDDNYVEELSPKDFEAVATWRVKKKGCVAVFFYLPNCPYCVPVKPEWSKLGKLSGFAEVAAFNSKKYSSHIMKIREDMPNLIPHFPTMIIYKDGNPITAMEGSRTSASFLTQLMNVCSSS